MSNETKVEECNASECIEILSQCYLILDSTNHLIDRTENRLAQLDFEARVDKPFLALVDND